MYQLKSEAALLFKGVEFAKQHVWTTLLRSRTFALHCRLTHTHEFA